MLLYNFWIIEPKPNWSFNEFKKFMDPSGFYFDKRLSYLPNLSFVESMIDTFDAPEADDYDYPPMMTIHQRF